MSDVVSKAKRSQMMSGIKGKDTKPEVILRKALYADGYRYRKHAKDIKAKPDIVLRKYNALIFVHGCYWHGHEDCKLFRLPKSNVEFWSEKISKNMERDKRQQKELIQAGWRVLVVWECSLRKNDNIEEAIRLTKCWINDETCSFNSIRYNQNSDCVLIQKAK